MKRHFPNGVHIHITFTDGTQEILSGQQLNEAYDKALADYRAGNHLDAKGFSRGPQKKVQQGIEYVPVKPGMGT